MSYDATKLQPQTMLMKSMDVSALAAPLVEPITLEEAKHHLNVVYDDDDAYISSLIIAARQMAEGRTNRTITQRELVATFDAWDAPIRLLKPPVISVNTVQYLDVDGLLQDWNDYDVVGDQVVIWNDFPKPVLRHRADAVRVTYTAGYPIGEVPQPIIQWMLLQIGSMYAHRESVIAGVSVAPLPEMYEKMFLQPYMVYE